MTARAPTPPAAFTLGGALRRAAADGLAAGRANLRPGLILWAVAVAVVVGYYHVPSVEAALVRVGGVKERFGFAFSAVSTAFFAAVLPILLGRLFGVLRLPDARGWLVIVPFWMERGMEVDALYRLQAWLFGDTPDAATVAAKVLFDQLLYVPLWAIPTMELAYRFKDRRPVPRRFGAWYVGDVLPLIAANYVIWVPAVTAIYMLPVPLQLPMANLVTCLWVLVFGFMTANRAGGA